MLDAVLDMRDEIHNSIGSILLTNIDDSCIDTKVVGSSGIESIGSRETIRFCGSDSSSELWGREGKAHLGTAQVLYPNLCGSEWRRRKVKEKM